MASGCHQVNASAPPIGDRLNASSPIGSSTRVFFREIVFGQREHIRYSHLTTDPKPLPPESTWYIMTNLAGKIQKTVGNTSGLRPWIEYGFTHAKNELGWADFRVTDYACIERWWELVSCADLLVSLQRPVLQPASTEPASPQAARVSTPTDRFSEHRWWDSGQGWKNILNNLRLILKPYVFYCLLLPWLLLFDIPSLRAGFLQLTGIMNLFHAASQLDRRGITPCLFHTRGSSKRV